MTQIYFGLWFRLYNAFPLPHELISQKDLLIGYNNNYTFTPYLYQFIMFELKVTAL